MLKPQQSRAARGWLDWSQDELAKRANMGLSTVRDFEKGRRTPIANNLESLRRAFEAAGVRFFDDGGPESGIAVSSCFDAEAKRPSEEGSSRRPGAGKRRGSAEGRKRKPPTD